MSNTIYQINKGVNATMEFRGLKAQYIGYLAGGLVAILVAFAIMYVIGVNAFICLFLTLVEGSILFVVVYRMNNTYGQYGLMRKAAAKRIPTVIRCSSRNKFLRGENSDGKTTGKNNAR